MSNNLTMFADATINGGVYEKKKCLVKLVF